MLTVNFYSFSKKSNSTAQPSGTPAASFECLLKEPCGIINPRILIKEAADWNPATLNYCYIPDFRRFYYVSWTYQRGIWEAACSVDVLASWKYEIGYTQLYVLRSSAAYDGNIIDTLYPSKVNSSYQVVTGSASFVLDPSGGWYVIGVISGNTPNYGSVTYYAIDSSNLLLLMDALNNDLVTFANGFTDQDAGYALQKALIDPFSYVVSCIWYPFDNLHDSPPVAGEPTAVEVLGISLGANGYYINAGNPMKTGTITLALPSHPSAASKGNYMNAAYRKVTACIPPFGTFEIDPSVSCNYSNVYCNYKIDCVSGNAVAEIGCGNTGLDHLLSRIETRFGVPIQLASVYQDVIGGISSVARGVTNSLIGIATMNPFMTMSGITSGVSDALSTMRPVLESIGTNGSFAALQDSPTPKLYVQFIYQVDEDNYHAGRPLCQDRRPADLGGYMLIRDGDVPLPATRAEIESVKGYLETGFYYE